MSIVIDGVSVLINVGKLIGTHQQLCFTHGIHLAIKFPAPCTNKNKQSTNESDDNNIDVGDVDDGVFEIGRFIDFLINRHPISPPNKRSINYLLCTNKIEEFT